MKQLLKGIACIHEQHIIIRDIALKTFILDGDPKKVKVLILEKAINENQFAGAYSFGTPGYIAPEIL